MAVKGPEETFHKTEEKREECNQVNDIEYLNNWENSQNIKIGRGNCIYSMTPIL